MCVRARSIYNKALVGIGAFSPSYFNESCKYNYNNNTESCKYNMFCCITTNFVVFTTKLEMREIDEIAFAVFTTTAKKLFYSNFAVVVAECCIYNYNYNLHQPEKQTPDLFVRLQSSHRESNHALTLQYMT